jgi:hypothetical protein
MNDDQKILPLGSVVKAYLCIHSRISLRALLFGVDPRESMDKQRHPSRCLRDCMAAVGMLFAVADWALPADQFAMRVVSRADCCIQVK